MRFVPNPSCAPETNAASPSSDGPQCAADPGNRSYATPVVGPSWLQHRERKCKRKRKWKRKWMLQLPVAKHLKNHRNFFFNFIMIPSFFFSFFFSTETSQKICENFWGNFFFCERVFFVFLKKIVQKFSRLFFLWCLGEFLLSNFSNCRIKFYESQFVFFFKCWTAKAKIFLFSLDYRSLSFFFKII